MNMTLSENSQGYIGGAGEITHLNINATGGSTAFVYETIVKKADFNATDMSHIGYNFKPKSLVRKATRGGVIKQFLSASGTMPMRDRLNRLLSSEVSIISQSRNDFDKEEATD